MRPTARWSASSPPSGASSSRRIRSRRCCVRRSSPPRIRASTPTSASAFRASSSPRSRTSCAGSAAGASTLTQQLARNLFLTNEKTLDRKIKEAFLTIQIEKRYTKREIFTLYCNHIPWGHGTYGAEAASRLYFGKSAKDLTLEEAALLAGIIQRPSRQSPYVNPDAARRRRNYALQRMADERFITQARADQAKQAPIVTSGRPVTNTFAPFFLEDVRQHLEERYGAKRLYESGLAVYTSLDADLQRAAEAAFDAGLRKVDKRRGFRKPRRNVVAEGSTIDTFQHDRWKAPIRVGDIVPAVVVGSGGARSAGGTGSLGPPASGTLLRRNREVGLRVDA